MPGYLSCKGFLLQGYSNSLKWHRMLLRMLFLKRIWLSPLLTLGKSVIFPEAKKPTMKHDQNSLCNYEGGCCNDFWFKTVFDFKIQSRKCLNITYICSKLHIQAYVLYRYQCCIYTDASLIPQLISNCKNPNKQKILSNFDNAPVYIIQRLFEGQISSEPFSSCNIRDDCSSCIKQQAGTTFPVHSWCPLIRHKKRC